jgi:hypothetical protein
MTNYVAGKSKDICGEERGYSYKTEGFQVKPIIQDLNWNYQSELMKYVIFKIALSSEEP